MQKSKILKLIGMILLVVLIAGQPVRAQTSAGYDLHRWQVASGGLLTGSRYTMFGLLGQTEAGPTFAGGDYTLSNGFLSNPGPKRLYLPVITR